MKYFCFVLFLCVCCFGEEEKSTCSLIFRDARPEHLNEWFDATFLGMCVDRLV